VFTRNSLSSSAAAVAATTGAKTAVIVPTAIFWENDCVYYFIFLFSL